MITANQLMLQSLCGLPVWQGRKLSRRLTKHLDDGIIEEDGCWFLASERRANKQYTLSQFQDHTGLECFINHLHIDARNEHDFVRVLEQGFLLLNALLGLLEPHGVFKIILGFNRSADPDHQFMAGTVRFHKVRPAEEWLDTDLEKYQTDAIFVFATDKRLNPGIVSESTWPILEPSSIA
jgi:hypothetical protein